MSMQGVRDGAQEQGPVRDGAGNEYGFEQFTAVRRYQPTLTFSPDGGEVAYSTNTSGQFNLWRQSSDGGYPHQLTVYSEEAVREVAWSPDGETILFTADRQGDEFRQVYLIPARGGRPVPLTAAPQAQFNLASEPWSPDGRSIAWVQMRFTGGDVAFQVIPTLWRRSVTGGTPRRIAVLDRPAVEEGIHAVPELAWQPRPAA